VIVEFDPVKREQCLAERGIDFARAIEVFGGHHFTAEDLRESYGESRFIAGGVARRTHGHLGLDSARRGSPHHQHEKSQ
jgi:uncharacterized DUF497 family protein